MRYFEQLLSCPGQKWLVQRCTWSNLSCKHYSKITNQHLLQRRKHKV